MKHRRQAYIYDYVVVLLFRLIQCNKDPVMMMILQKIYINKGNLEDQEE